MKNVNSQMTIRGIVYGYCDCGREVNKTKNPSGTPCPLCSRTLHWDEPKKEVE